MRRADPVARSGRLAASRIHSLIPAAILTASLIGPTATEARASVESGQPEATEVAVTLRVQGELFAEAATNQPPVSQPIELEAEFQFTERQPTGVAAAAVRTYHAATAAFTTDGATNRTTLASDAREVLVALRGTTPMPHLADGFLAREEAELLDVPFESVLIDGMRPAEPVSASAAWTVAADLTAGLLAIDTVESGSLEARLVEVVDGMAEVSLAGTVSGAVDGAPTRLEVSGGYRCPAAADDAGAWRLEGRIETLDVEIVERREAGWVAPGLDVTAHLRLVRTAPDREPNAERGVSPGSSERGDRLLPAASDRPRGFGRPGTVWERHRQGRYTLVLDDRWRVVEDGSEGLVMRLVDRGALVAQCSILPLPRTAADAAPSAETVRGDVERSLGDQFGRITAAEESTRDDGTRVVRVIAEGTADDRPFRWVHQVLTDPAGYRAAVTCMHEPAMADRFAIADREIAAGLVLLPDRPAERPRKADNSPDSPQASRSR